MDKQKKISDESRSAALAAEEKSSILLGLLMWSVNYASRFSSFATIWESRDTIGGDLYLIRIGIYIGYCNVGNFGSDQRLSYTIIGGKVNVVQRLEANYDPGGILINHETYSQVDDLVDDLVDVEERQSVSLKGILLHARIYAIKGRKAEANKLMRLSHPQGMYIDLLPLSLGVDDRQLIASQHQALAQRLEDQ